MSSTILHKRSSTAGKVPVLSSLQLGEIAINTVDGNLFIKTFGDVVETFIPRSKHAITFDDSLSSFKPQMGQNNVWGVFSGIHEGYNNDISGAGSTVLNGENNDIGGDFSTILNGLNNKIEEQADYGSIMGGIGNLLSHANSFILGSNLSSHSPDFTYTENLSCVGNFYVSGDVNLGAGDDVSLCVDGNKIGINLINPTTTLDISGNSIRLRNSKTPSSSTSVGNIGEICWDQTYLYVCVSTNTWKRISYENSNW